MNLLYSLENVHTASSDHKNVGAAFAETKNYGAPKEYGGEDLRKNEINRKS